MITWLVPTVSQPIFGQPTSPQSELDSLPVPSSIAEALDFALVELRKAENGSGIEANKALTLAQAYLNPVFEREPGNPRARYYQGRMLVLSGRPQEALGRLRDWRRTREGRNDWEVHFILGKVYQGMEFEKLAKPVLETAVELNAREPRCHAALARCAARLQLRDLATRHARLAIEMLGDAVDIDSYLLLSDSLLLSNDYLGAEQAGRFAKNLSTAAARESGGDIGSLAKTNQCILQLIKITQLKLQDHPERVELYLEASRLVQEQADLAWKMSAHQALEWTGKGLRKAGESPPEALLVDAAQLLMKVGNTDGATQVANRIIEQYPQNDDARRILEQLRSAAKNKPPPSAAVHSP